MIEVDTLHLRSDNSLLTVYNIIKKRLETEDLNAEVRAIFIINLDILESEIERRGLSYDMGNNS